MGAFFYPSIGIFPGFSANTPCKTALNLLKYNRLEKLGFISVRRENGHRP